MARRTVSFATFTPSAFADTANMTSGLYANILQGGTTTQLNKVWEISISGQAASSSSPTFMILSRDSTVAATNTLSSSQYDAANDPATLPLANPPLTGSTNTTAPQRSATFHLANCSLNAFGGVYFWRANRLEECYTTLGNTASNGEVSLSAFTGGTVGLIGTHMIYESI